MEQFGWTERELYEEVSIATVQRIGVLNERRAAAAKVKEAAARMKALRRR